MSIHDFSVYKEALLEGRKEGNKSGLLRAAKILKKAAETEYNKDRGYSIEVEMALLSCAELITKEANK